MTVAGEIVGVAGNGPDADAVILQGLQGVSQQLSAFALATSLQFQGLDARLERLTRDVGVLADRLGAQLTDLRSQVSNLGTALITLQGSVDRLHSEIKLLFAQDARNALNTVINQLVGPGGLTARELQIPAGALYADATDIALKDTLLIAHDTFDARTTGALGGLDPNINYFAGLPERVTDAPAGLGWPASLARTCTGGDPDRQLCLPDPNFWATASRAYAQLLLREPRCGHPRRLAQLDAMIARGGSLDIALDRITANDDGDRATGSRLLNAALSYYGSWVGREADRPAQRATDPAAGDPRPARGLHREPARTGRRGGEALDRPVRHRVAVARQRRRVPARSVRQRPDRQRQLPRPEPASGDEPDRVPAGRDRNAARLHAAGIKVRSSTPAGTTTSSRRRARRRRSGPASTSA